MAVNSRVPALPDLTGKTIQGFLGCYELQEIIGSGSFGVVYRAVDTNRKSNKTWAVKCIPSAPFPTLEPLLDDLRRLSPHENVVDTREYFRANGCHFMVLEYCKAGALIREPSFEHEMWGCSGRIKEVVLQMIAGLEFCHNHKVFHRDLKLHSFLLGDDGTVRLSNFGMSKSIKIPHRKIAGVARRSPESIAEGHLNIEYSHAEDDIWALCIVIATIVNAEAPWRIATEADAEFRSFRQNENHFFERNIISEQFHTLLKQMFHAEPKKRPTLAQLRTAITDMPTFYPKIRRFDEEEESETEDSETSSVTLVEEKDAPEEPASEAEEKSPAKGGEKGVVTRKLCSLFSRFKRRLARALRLSKKSRK